MFSAEHTFSERELMLFEHMIDYDVIDYDTYMSLYDDSMEVDYQLVNDAIVITDDYFAIITDGTFRPNNHDEESITEQLYPDKIPAQVEDKAPA